MVLETKQRCGFYLDSYDLIYQAIANQDGHKAEEAVRLQNRYSQASDTLVHDRRNYFYRSEFACSPHIGGTIAVQS
ncbi:hypothetical protein [Paenibacillus sp. FSL R5-0912]|uniref:hypothetical protein n=1 Tax=unclassified Paenibacillus TaxID=185978 RepID=UPI0004F6A6FF|nr:hypothetical protein R50912_29435 [Paenibacillus sp. FSL R5-0912]